MRASDAATLLGVSRSTITRMVQRGQLQARRDPRDARVLLVDRDQVEKLLADIRAVHGDSGDEEP